MTTRAWIFGSVLILILGVTSVWGESPVYTLGTSSVEILSPLQDSISTSSTVRVEFRFLKGRKDGGDHLHVSLDGEHWGTIKSSPVTFKKLSKGLHTVTIEVSTRDHVLLGARSSIQFQVQPPEEQQKR